MPGLITQELKLKEVYPDLAAFAASVQKDYGLADEPVFIRKGLIPSDLKFDEGERSSIDYITTIDKDRDNEIVDPAGCILTDYMKNPVVLFGHNHYGMPVGKCAWIKSDAKGLVAKTIYANTAQANEIYEYRKAGFPMAKSIGFIPLEAVRYSEGTPEYAQGVYRKFTRWLLLEYSDVPVPSNPEALEIAVSKGLLKPEEAAEYTILLEDEKAAPKEETKEQITEPEVKAEEIPAPDAEPQTETKTEEPVIEKSGRVLSAKNRTIIEAAVSALNELLTATEPASEEPEDEDEEDSKGIMIETEENELPVIMYDEQVKESGGDAPAFTIDDIAPLVKSGIATALDERLIPAIKEAARDAVNIRRGRLN